MRGQCPPWTHAPNDGLEEDEQGLDEHGGVHDVESLDVLLVPAEAEQALGGQAQSRALMYVSWLDDSR